MDGDNEVLGVSGSDIFNRGTDILSSLLKPKPAAPAAAKPVTAAPAAAPAKTNFLPWIIGGSAVLIVGGIVIVVALMGGRRTATA